METHALLTKEIVSFYNAHYTLKVPEDIIPYLIDGARHEDTNPRYMNHFYDPVNDRGLEDGIYRGQGSKYWASDERSQSSLIYKLFARTADSILSANQLSKIDSVYYKTNFTWQKAINLYAEGKTEEAMFALGHIIHLIEDASVPDHVRNDAHPPFDDGGSPYENWTKKFNTDNPDTDLKNRLSSKKPVFYSSLNAYFDGLSGYTSNNFYSRDSIDKFELPKGDYMKNENDKNFIYRKDNEFGDYRLAIGGTFEWTKNNIETIEAPAILLDYWSRLSVKSVQHGAGVLNLFFKEAEKAKKEIEREKSGRPYMGILMNGFSGLLGSNEIAYDSSVDPVYGLPASTPEIPATVLPTVAPAPVLLNSAPVLPEPTPELPTPGPTPLPAVTVTPTPVLILTPTPALGSSAHPIYGSGGGVSLPPATPTPVPEEITEQTIQLETEEDPTPTPEPSPSPEPSPDPTPTPEPGPGFLSDFNFFKNADGKYYLRLAWEKYPFIPSVLNFHSVIVYYNNDAPETSDLMWIDYSGKAPYKAWGAVAPGGLKLKYPNCFGGKYFSYGSSIILPDTAKDCNGLAGNFASMALNFDLLEDNEILVEVYDEKIFSGSLEGPIAGKDYVSLAYYAYQKGYEPNNYAMRLVATDPERYYFQEGMPGTQSPTTPEGIAFEFIENESVLKISWNKSSDPDTRDSLLRYEVRQGENVTQTLNNFMQISVEPGNVYDFEIRTFDGSDNFSGIASGSFSVPPVLQSEEPGQEPSPEPSPEPTPEPETETQISEL